MNNVKQFRALANVESPTFLISTPKWRAFLDYVCPGFYVESSKTGKGGTVKNLRKDKLGIPYELRVERAGEIFTMNVSDVDFFEPYDSWVSSCEEYDFEYWDNLPDSLREQGYIERDGCFFDPKTGEEIIW